MTDKISMVIFKKEDIENFIPKLGNSIDKNGYIINENGEKVTCETCKCEITKENLGNILPGSKLFFCDNPACFAGYVSKKII